MNTKSLQSQPYNGEATMFKDFWEIDKSQGESRFSQLLGIWLLICLIPFSILHLEGTNLSGANLKMLTFLFQIYPMLNSKKLILKE